MKSYAFFSWWLQSMRNRTGIEFWLDHLLMHYWSRSGNRALLIVLNSATVIGLSANEPPVAEANTIRQQLDRVRNKWTLDPTSAILKPRISLQTNLINPVIVVLYSQSLDPGFVFSFKCTMSMHCSWPRIGWGETTMRSVLTWFFRPWIEYLYRMINHLVYYLILH